MKAGWMEVAAPTWLAAPSTGVCDGDGPSLGKINLLQLTVCPASSSYESAPNPSMFQGKNSKIICLRRNELPCSWDSVRIGTCISITQLPAVADETQGICDLPL